MRAGDLMTMRDKLTAILEIDSQAARRVFEECLSEDGDFEVLGAGEDFADLLVREVHPEYGETELESVAALVADGGEREVFLTAANYDAAVLMRLMRQGVREFFPQPVGKKQTPLSRKLERLTSREGRADQLAADPPTKGARRRQRVLRRLKGGFESRRPASPTARPQSSYS